MCGRIIQAGFGGMKIMMGTPDDSPHQKKSLATTAHPPKTLW
jgi:hypothetical protein